MAQTIISVPMDEIAFKPGEVFSVDVDAKNNPYWKTFEYKTQYPGEPVKVMTMHEYVASALPKAQRPKGNDPWGARSKALAYVNTARAALGHKPLKRLPSGQPGSNQECVLARALPGCTGVGSHISFECPGMATTVATTWATNVSGHSVRTPDALIEFIHHFDHKHYRDLVA